LEFFGLRKPEHLYFRLPIAPSLKSETGSPVFAHETAYYFKPGYQKSDPECRRAEHVTGPLVKFTFELIDVASQGISSKRNRTTHRDAQKQSQGKRHRLTAGF